MAKRYLLIFGWLWPFLVSIGGVSAIRAGFSLSSDADAMVLFFCSLLGFPAIVATLNSWMPGAWSNEARRGLACLLAFPIVGVEVFLATLLLIVGANAAGPGWIE